MNENWTFRAPTRANELQSHFGTFFQKITSLPDILGHNLNKKGVVAKIGSRVREAKRRISSWLGDCQMRGFPYSVAKKFFGGFVFLAFNFSWGWAADDFAVDSSQETFKMRGIVSKGGKGRECKEEINYDALSREHLEELKKLEEINNKIKEANQKVKNNEMAIEKAKDLLKKLHEEESRRKVREAVRRLEEVKEKNLQSIQILVDERKKVLSKLSDLEVMMKNYSKAGERLPPYFVGEVPPVNCEIILEGMDKEKRERCYCLAPKRAPLCFSSMEEKEAYILKLSKGRKTYNCYWKVEAISASGGYGISDGTYWGQHGTYEEAWQACKKDAERTMELGEFKILNFECFCYE